MRLTPVPVTIAVLLVTPVFGAPGDTTPIDDYRAAWSAHDDAVGERLRERVELLSAGVLSEVAGTPIAAAERLQRVYEARRFRPLWSHAGRRAELVGLVEASAAEGLDPDDYHLDAVRALAARPVAAQPTTAADEDILLTDAFLRLERHLRHGKVDPHRLDPDWNFDGRDAGADPPSATASVLAADSLADALAASLGRGQLYRTLTEALADYRRIANAGGWQPVSTGPTLKSGAADTRVVEVRSRLAAEFALADAAEPRRYDEALEAAVKRFQHRYGIDADGAVGRKTLEAMNVPVAARIDQIRVNLERARWVLPASTTDYLVVNIAGFQAILIRDANIVWQTRVVVGTPYRRTPVFRANLTYLVFNPTWTVPPVILEKDILPEMLTDGQGLARRGLAVFDNDGRRIVPETIDWTRYADGGFPYQLVQPPGPRNALGRVKFILPNRHHVFLHDTPARDLFDRSERTFSSGCIRVERPLELAELLLRDAPDWDRAAIDRAVASGQTRTVFLPRPMPVLLLYWTAGLGPDGEFVFHEDVYGRDPAVLAALNRRFPTDASGEGRSASVAATHSENQALSAGHSRR